MISHEVILSQALHHNKELKRENKELNSQVMMLANAINKLEKQPEFSKAHKFLMDEIPTVECP